MNEKIQRSLYIHIPFCVKKCLFCSFAVTIGQSHRVDEYLDALEKEARAYKGALLKTIYLGGGTPSFLSVEQIKRLYDIIRNNYSVSSDAQWSIEINPDNVDRSFTKRLKTLRFDRVSLGVQSFNDTYLKFLGRAHDRAQAVRAFHILREHGFSNINIDLMYGFPSQTKEQLMVDLEETAALNSEHASIYTLTIEPNSRFYAKQMKLDNDDKLAEHYEFVAAFLENTGLRQYEVSNFAKTGFESKHNLVYWQGGDYIGLGMGAHSFMHGRRFWNTSSLMDYLGQINTKGNAIAGEEILNKQTQLTERLIFGLRMNAGVNVPVLEKEFGLDLTQTQKELLRDLAKEGLLETESGNVKTTMRGRLVLDEIASRLV